MSKTKAFFLILIAFVGVVYFLAWFIPVQKQYNGIVNADIASTTPKEGALDILIEEKTDERMRDPAFVEKMRLEARIDVVSAIHSLTEAELYDYKQAIEAQLKALE